MRCRICSPRRRGAGVLRGCMNELDKFKSLIQVIFTVHQVTCGRVLIQRTHFPDSAFLRNRVEMNQPIARSQGLFPERKKKSFSSSPPLSSINMSPGSGHIWCLFLTGCATRWVVFTASLLFRQCQISCQSQN